MIAQVLAVVAAFSSGWAFSLLWKQKKLARRSLLIVTNGKTVEIKECENTDGNFVCRRNEIYPDAGAMRAYHGADTYYLLAVEPVALVTHRRLERLRPSIVVGSLFRPGGDFAELVKWVAIAGLMVVTLWISFSFGGVSDSISRQALQVEQMRKTLEKPLVSVPAVPAILPTVGATK